MDRRNFMTASLKLGGWALASGMMNPFFLRKAMAQTTNKENFLFIRVGGGWDTSLSTDPWTQNTLPDPTDFFVEYTQSDLIQANGAFFGPAMGSIKKYLNSMTVINGILVNVVDGGHDSAAMYMSSGNGQGSLGTINVELEEKLQSSSFGIFTNSSLQVGAQNPMVVNTNGFQRMTSQEFWMNQEARSTELVQDKLQLNKNQTQISAFNSKLDQITASMPSGSSLTEKEIVAAAFATGISRSAFISIQDVNLDTHSGHANNHMQQLTKAFAEVSQILDRLASTADSAGSSLLDNTTVIITSEFTRTPALNASKGKDHNPQCNSMIVISPHLKPGVLGAGHLVDRKSSPTSTPYLAAAALDANTFMPVNTLSNAFILRPESIFATLFKTMGVDPATVAASMGKAPILTSILK